MPTPSSTRAPRAGAPNPPPPCCVGVPYIACRIARAATIHRSGARCAVNDPATRILLQFQQSRPKAEKKRRYQIANRAADARHPGEENRAVYSAPTKSARATSGRKRPHARSCHPPPRTRTHAMSVANFGSECVLVGGARSEPFGASANAPRSARVNRQRPAPPRSRRPFAPLTPLSPPRPIVAARSSARAGRCSPPPRARRRAASTAATTTISPPLLRPAVASTPPVRSRETETERETVPRPKGPAHPARPRSAVGSASARPRSRTLPRPLASISQARASPRSRPSRASTRARTPSRGRPRSTGLRIPRGSPRGARTANSTSAPPRWARAGSTRRSRGQTTRRVRRWRR